MALVQGFMDVVREQVIMALTAPLAVRRTGSLFPSGSGVIKSVIKFLKTLGCNRIKWSRFDFESMILVA